MFFYFEDFEKGFYGDETEHGYDFDDFEHRLTVHCTLLYW